MPDPVVPITELLPKSFNPTVDTTSQDCQIHFIKFEDYLSHHKITEFQTIKDRFKLTLDGSARLWFERNTSTDLDALKTEFINKFTPYASKIKTIKTFNDKTIGNQQSIDAFLNELVEMGDELNYSEEQVKQKFLLSLPNECQRTILITKPNGTLEDFKSMAQSFMEFEKPTILTASHEHDFSITSDEIRDLKQEISDLKDQVRRMDQGQQPCPPSQQSMDGGQQPCPQWRDDGRQPRPQRREGHTNVRSRSRPPSRNFYKGNSQFNSRIPECDFCGKRGHLAHQCWIKNGYKNSRDANNQHQRSRTTSGREDHRGEYGQNFH